MHSNIICSNLKLHYNVLPVSPIGLKRERDIKNKKKSKREREREREREKGERVKPAITKSYLCQTKTIFFLIFPGLAILLNYYTIRNVYLRNKRSRQ